MAENIRWEFNCESDAGPTGLMKKIEALGDHGWDLVSVVFDGKRFQAFLKRLRQQGTDKPELPAS